MLLHGIRLRCAALYALSSQPFDKGSLALGNPCAVGRIDLFLYAFFCSDQKMLYGAFGKIEAEKKN